MIGCKSPEESRVLAAWLRGPSALVSPKNVSVPLVLFLCRSNTAISSMAEALLRHLAHDHIRAASAGLSPCAHVDPYALECLRKHGIATTGLRSKGYDAFLGAYRPPVRFLIALSEGIGSEAHWYRDTIQPTKTQWVMPDPTAVVGSERDVRGAFDTAFLTLDSRIRKFLALPLGLSGPSLTEQLERIGESS